MNPSYLSYYPSDSYHLIACQFERQWLAQARLFSEPLEQALAFCALWHLPLGHQLLVPKIESAVLQRWIEESAVPNVERLCHRPPTDCLIQPFGISPAALTWVHQQGARVGVHAPLELIQKLHDKRFIEEKTGPLDPALPEGWIESIDELIEHLQTHPLTRFLIKRPWASAGLGNQLIEPSKPLPLKNLQRWQQFDGGWILQPFVERLVDFSSLWWIHPGGHKELFSMTRMQTSLSGRYQGCLIGDDATLFGRHLKFIHQHLDEARALLTTCAQAGYVGPLGLDGMIYRDSCGLERVAIIEMNVRQTLAMHVVSIGRTLYPNLKKGQLLLAKLVPPSLKRSLRARYLLPPLEGTVNLIVEPQNP